MANPNSSYSYTWTVTDTSLTSGNPVESNTGSRLEYTPGVEGTYTVALVATDEYGTTFKPTPNSISITVKPVAPTAIFSVGNLTASSGTGTVTASLSNAYNPAGSGMTYTFTYAIDGGSQSSGAAGPSMSQDFPISAPGVYTFWGTVSDAEGLSTTYESSLAISNLPIAGALTPPSAMAGVAVSNATVFNFTDADPNATVADYTAVVTLGDGNQVNLTSVPGPNGQIVTDSSSGFDVQLSYTYAAELSGATFAVEVTAADGATAGDSVSNFTVAAAVPAATGLQGVIVPPVAAAGTPVSVVLATFNDTVDLGDPNPGDYTATIAWSNGQTSTGTITYVSGSQFEVSGAA